MAKKNRLNIVGTENAGDLEGTGAAGSGDGNPGAGSIPMGDLGNQSVQPTAEEEQAAAYHPFEVRRAPAVNHVVGPRAKLIERVDTLSKGVSNAYAVLDDLTAELGKQGKDAAVLSSDVARIDEDLIGLARKTAKAEERANAAYDLGRETIADLTTRTEGLQTRIDGQGRDLGAKIDAAKDKAIAVATENATRHADLGDQSTLSKANNHTICEIDRVITFVEERQAEMKAYADQVRKDAYWQTVKYTLIAIGTAAAITLGTAGWVYSKYTAHNSDNKAKTLKAGENAGGNDGRTK